VDAERFLIVLPTYEERDNLPRVVEQIEAVLTGLPFAGDVLVVDDSSPDGTGELADELAAGRPWMHVLHRPRKEGLGPAYVAGFGWALERDYSHILEMDCDLSHPPAALPAMLEASRHADLVLGSRYVEGGGVENWGALRRLVSRGGSWYARAVLRVPVRDLTGGFKCFRRSVLEALDLNAVHANGYGFQIELTYWAIRAGFTVKEIPIRFRERREGHSKMTPRIALEAVWKVPAMRFRA